MVISRLSSLEALLSQELRSSLVSAQWKTLVVATKSLLRSKAATILRLLGNETIHFNTRGKKIEPDLRKQLNIEVKSTTKFKFFSLNIFIYKTAFYSNVFRRRLKSRNIRMVTVSNILHYKCVFSPKFNKLSKFFPVVWFVTI